MKNTKVYKKELKKIKKESLINLCIKKETTIAEHVAGKITLLNKANQLAKLNKKAAEHNDKIYGEEIRKLSSKLCRIEDSIKTICAMRYPDVHFPKNGISGIDSCTTYTGVEEIDTISGYSLELSKTEAIYEIQKDEFERFLKYLYELVVK